MFGVIFIVPSVLSDYLVPGPSRHSRQSFAAILFRARARDSSHRDYGEEGKLWIQSSCRGILSLRADALRHGRTAFPSGLLTGLCFVRLTPFDRFCRFVRPVVVLAELLHRSAV